jgi:hypothetical protein
MLRFKKRDTTDDIDDLPDEPLTGRVPESAPDSAEAITGEDGFPFPEDEPDGSRDDGRGKERGVRFLAAVPGPLIAVGAFVPTFLAIFFSLSYVVGTLQAGPTAGAPVPPGPTLTSDRIQGPIPPLAETLRDPFVARVFELPPTSPPMTSPREAASSSAEAREPLRPPSVAELPAPAPAIESTGPTLPPAQPRSAIAPAPEPRAGRSTAEAPRQPQAVVLNTTPERTPAASNRPVGSARDWTPAAAFADREAASRLASSIQQQGYPVEIRQESSSTRPWVVWIGAQPRAGERRR